MTRKQWLKERQSGIGGSDIAAIVGHDPRRDALSVFNEKMGLIQQDEDESADLERGRMLEPIVARKLAQVTGRHMIRVPGIIRHQVHAFLIGSLDRRWSEKRGQPAKGDVEIKTMRVAPFSKIVRDGLPAHHVAQGNWYLGLDGMPTITFAPFSMEHWKLVHFDIEANESLIRQLQEAGIQFYHDHIEKEVPPRPADFAVPVAVQKSGKEVVMRDDPAFRSAVNSYIEARELEATGKRLKDEAKALVVETLDGQHGAFRCDGAIAHHLAHEGRNSFDAKSMLAARPIDRQKLLSVVAKIQAGMTDPERLAFSALQEALQKDALTLDLAQFNKRGAAYNELRVYVRGDTED